MDSPPPSILHLPAELLIEILTLTVPSIKPLEEDAPVRKLSESPFHAVRSTCRTFRWIVNELPFWMDDDFNIAEINNYGIPEINNYFHSEDEESYHSGFDSDSDDYYGSGIKYSKDMSRVMVMLSDSHLRERLRGKTSWFCDGLDVLEPLQRYMPRFGSQVRQLRFHNDIDRHDDNGTRRYLAYLASRDDMFIDMWRIFPTLTVLHLEGSTIHLRFLPRSLKKLILDAPLCSNCHRCQNALRNLEQLCLLYHDYHSHTELKKALPLNSKTSLRELELSFPIACDPSTDAIRHFSLLHRFENLTILRLSLTTSGIKDVNIIVNVYQNLSHCPFRLKTFESDSPEPRPNIVNALVNLLKSPVLHNLQNLQTSFATYTHPRCAGQNHIEMKIEDKHIYEPFITAVANLPALENLELYFFPLLVDWISNFRNSQSLKSVRWLYRDFEPIEVVGEYNLGELENSLWHVLYRAGAEIPRSALRIKCFGHRSAWTARFAFFKGGARRPRI
jgi:hypothetical protein